jgi:hypothetical protein
VFADGDPFWNSTWNVVNPRHFWIQIWDLNTLIMLVFTCLVTPYEIAFLDGIKGTNVEVLFAINQVINIIFVLDMVLVFFLPFEGPNGCWVGLSLPGGVRLVTRTIPAVTWTIPAVINWCVLPYAL